MPDPELTHPYQLEGAILTPSSNNTVALSGKIHYQNVVALLERTQKLITTQPVEVVNLSGVVQGSSAILVWMLAVLRLSKQQG